jgi:hypothetical protein
VNKLLAIAGVTLVAALLLVGCNKKKPAPVDPAEIQNAVASLSKQLPVQLGVELTFSAAKVDGDRVEFDYLSPFPSKDALQPRTAALMRGSMMQYACGNKAARSILDAGVTINHRVVDVQDRELYTTSGDSAICAQYAK